MARTRLALALIADGRAPEALTVARQASEADQKSGEAFAVFGTAIREAGWPPRYAFHVARVPYERSGQAKEDVAGWTRAWLSVLETYVRRFPEQYLWLHKRWRD